MQPLYKIRVAHFDLDELSGLVTCHCFTVGREEAEARVCTTPLTLNMWLPLKSDKNTDGEKCAYLSCLINKREGRTKVYNEKVDAAAELLNSIKTKSIAA